VEAFWIWAGTHWFLGFILAFAALGTTSTLVKTLTRFLLFMIRGYPPKHINPHDWTVISDESVRKAEVYNKDGTRVN